MIRDFKQFVTVVFWTLFFALLFAYAAHGPEMFGWGYLQ
jgi:hypothetical protein